MSPAFSADTASKPAPRRIDAHHHLWRYTAQDFGWIDDSMAALRKDFLAPELAREMDAARIDAAVAVQARPTLQETEFLLACAASTPQIAGVVGWAPLRDPALPDLLDRFAGNPHLVGFREVAQGQPAGFFEDAAFNDGVRAVTACGLTYDILIFAGQLPEATSFVDRHPNQPFVLDHVGKPRIQQGEIEPWSTNLRELARRPNVSCKLSGMVTEADRQHWTSDSLRPFLDVCVEAFTPQRLLAGSDWPVCLAASTYSRWWQTLRQYFATFSAQEQDAVFGQNAERFYKLPH